VGDNGDSCQLDIVTALHLVIVHWCNLHNPVITLFGPCVPVSPHVRSSQFGLIVPV